MASFLDTLQKNFLGKLIGSPAADLTIRYAKAKNQKSKNGPVSKRGEITATQSYDTTPYSGETTSSGSSGSSGGSGGGYSSAVSAYNDLAEANRAVAKSTYDQTVSDLNTALDRYRQEIETSRNLAQQSYNDTADNLLTSLKRYQEQNAKDVENQKRSYLSGQSALDSARSEADRNTRISAAARGLGGSGLQQLAMLQNLISQGEEVSDLALDNQNEMDTLRKALAQREEDYDTSIKKARQTLDNTLNQLNTNLSNKEADTSTGLARALENYNNTLLKINADLAANKVGAVGSYGSGGSSSSGISDQQGYATNIAGQLQSIQNAFERGLDDVSGNSKNAQKSAKALYDDYMSKVDTILGAANESGYDYSGLVNTGYNNGRNLYNMWKRTNNVK